MFSNVNAIYEFNDKVFRSVMGIEEYDSSTWLEDAACLEDSLLSPIQFGREVPPVMRVLSSLYSINWKPSFLAALRREMYKYEWKNNMVGWLSSIGLPEKVVLYRGWVALDDVADDDMVHSSWTTDYNVALYHATNGGLVDGKVATLEVDSMSDEFMDLFVIALNTDEYEVILHHLKLQYLYKFLGMKVVEVGKDAYEPK